MRISARAGIEDRVVYQHAFLGSIDGKRGRFDEALKADPEGPTEFGSTTG